MTRLHILSLLGALLCCLSLPAQSAHWVVPPVYSATEPLSDQWIRVNRGGLWGIIDTNGKEMVPCAYEHITAFAEGHCLLLKGDKLLGVFSRDGSCCTFQDDMFVDLSYPYFSEGLLAVRDVANSWTYMTPDGKFPIRMVFLSAAPFSYGLAAVREKSGEGSYLHIDKKGRVSVLSSDYPDNYLIFASSFTDLNGQAGALVVDGHSQVSLRSLGGAKLMDFGSLKSFDKENQVLKTKGFEIALSGGRFIQSRKRLSDAEVKPYYSEPDRHFSPVDVPSLGATREGGLVGISWNDQVLLEPQFESLVELSENRVLAMQQGKIGLLGIEKTGKAPTLLLNKTALVVRHPDDLFLSGELVLPASVPFKDVRMRVREISGVSQEFALERAHFTIPVVHLIKDLALELRGVISASGLTYPPFNITIPVEYRSAFTVEAPSHVTLQSGNEKAVFSLQVRNNADVPAASCDVLVDGRFIQSLEKLDAGKQISIPLSFQVSLEDLDSVTREIKVEIREKDVPAYKTRIQVSFNRNFN